MESDKPSRQIEYRALWRRFKRSIQWMETRDFTCIAFTRIPKLPWMFLAIRSNRCCIVLSRRKTWLNDEELQKIRAFQFQYIDVVVLRWDLQAKRPRVGIARSKKVEESFADELNG